MAVWMALLLSLTVPDTLTLEQAQTLFFQQNPDLQALQLQTRWAGQNWARSLSTWAFPQFQASYQYQNLRREPETPGFGFLETPPEWHSLTLQLEQTLWNGYSLAHVLDRWWEYRKTQEQARQTRNQLVLTLYQTFLEGVEGQEALALAVLQVQRARETLEQVKQRQALGDASRVEVLQAELQWQQARLDSLQAVQRHRQALQKLAQLLGMEHPSPSWVLLPDTAASPSPEGWLQNLRARLRQHPEIRQAQWSLQQGRTGFWFTVLSFLPTVKYGITWSYGDEAFPAWQRFQDQHTRTRGWYVSLVFPFHTYPWDVALQKTSWDLAATQARRAWLQRWTEVQNALSAYESAQEGLQLAKTGLTLAQESFRLARAQYQQGLISEVELLNAQEKLKQAELQHLQAQTQYRLALYHLKLAVGEDLP